MRRALAAAALLAVAADELPTPMAERLGVVAALDKRTGKYAEFRMRPGDVVRFGPLTVRLRACEGTPAWVRPLEEGGFVQVDQDVGRGRQRRLFSGWLFARAPSLNALQNRDYDVWFKNCAMRFPETGPDTVRAIAPPPVVAPRARPSAKPGSATPTPAEPVAAGPAPAA